MRRLIKITTIITMILTMVLATGCRNGQPENDEPDKVRIAMIPKIIGISYFDKCAEGAQAVADKYGMELIYKGPTTADAASQVNIIQDMIYNGVDVIAVAPVDPEAVKPILLKAKEKGIKVITFDADSAPESRNIFVSQVSAEILGKHIMNSMSEMLGGEGDFAILTASMTADNQNTWIEWMEIQRLAEHKNMNLVTIIPTDEDQQKAYANTRNLIQAYPELDGIIAMSTEAGPAAAKAVEALNMSGEIVLYSLALPNDMRGHLKSGSVQLVTLWDPYKLGELTAEVANKLMTNEAITDFATFGDIGPIHYIEEEQVVIMGAPLDFTLDNIDDYDF